MLPFGVIPAVKKLKRRANNNDNACRHGGKQVSQYLAKRLHVLVEQVDSTSISPIVEWTKEKHGGYFKRWRGGALQRWTQWADGKREGEEIKEGKGNEAESRQGKTLMTLEERLTLAFLEVKRFPPTSYLVKRVNTCDNNQQADKEILTSIEKSDRCGSTASIALLHSLDSPSQPYWAAKRLAVTIAHCG